MPPKLPPQYYKCVVCGVTFQRGKTQNGKFCTKDCYWKYKRNHTPKEVSSLTPIPVEAPPLTALIPPEVKPAETIIPVVESGDDLVINFDDLTLTDIKMIISQLLDQVEYLESQLKKQHTTPLTELVQEFIKNVTATEGTSTCPGCEKKFTPSYTNQVFCTDECALAKLPPSGIIRMSDGRFLWNQKVVE
jgi:hypothetical protein